AITDLKASRELGCRCQCRPSPYMNNVLEQDHRFVRKRSAASLWFRSVDGALRTIAGYEAMNMIRKGQVRWLAKGDVIGQVRFIERTFGSSSSSQGRRRGRDGTWPKPCSAGSVPLSAIRSNNWTLRVSGLELHAKDDHGLGYGTEAGESALLARDFS